MNMHNQPPKRGRPRKDEALRLRDQYWILNLEAQLPEESLASLERILLPHVQVIQRGNGEGYSQPFSLTKVARGARGLSPHLDELPSVVSRAEQLWPGTIAVYKSILWSTLMGPIDQSGIGFQYDAVSPEVQSRLLERHFTISSKTGIKRLNRNGIRRLGRLRHLDALGLLLWHCPAVIGVSHFSLTAEAYVFHVLHRSSCRDPALRALAEALIALIKERFRVPPTVDTEPAAGNFLAPSVSVFEIAVRSILEE